MYIFSFSVFTRIPLTWTCPRCFQSFKRPRALRRHDCRRRVVPLLSLAIPPPRPPPAVAASVRPASEEQQRESESHAETSPPGVAPPSVVVPLPAVVGCVRLIEEEWQQEPMCDIEPPPPGTTPPPAVEHRPLSPLATPPVIHITPDRRLAPPASEHPSPPPQVTPPVVPAITTDHPSQFQPPDPTPPAANNYCWSSPISTPPPPGFIPATPDYCSTSPRQQSPSDPEGAAVTDSPDHRPPRHRSPRTANAAVQCSGDSDRRGCVRQLIFRGREHGAYLRPITSHLRHRTLAEDRPRDVDLTVDPTRQRRVCDCRTCPTRLAAGRRLLVSRGSCRSRNQVLGAARTCLAHQFHSRP